MKYLEKLVQWLSDRNNITFLIAVTGFIMSVYNFAENLAQKKVRITAEVSDVFRAGNESRCLETICLKVVNLSNEPVVLSGVKVENYKHKGSFGRYQKGVFTFTNRTAGKVTSVQKWTADRLPVTVDSKGCVSLLLAGDSETPAFAEHTENIVTIRTDRKKITQRLHLSTFSDLMLIPKCRESDS